MVDNREPFEEETIIKKGRFQSIFFDWGESIVIALITIVILFTFFGRLVGVDGSSMFPTLHEKDIMLVSDFAYTPEKSDIIVLHQPDIPGFIEGPIVKRIIATGGDEIDIDFDLGKVYVNGEELDEPYGFEKVFIFYQFPKLLLGLFVQAGFLHQAPVEFHLPKFHLEILKTRSFQAVDHHGDHLRIGIAGVISDHLCSGLSGLFQPSLVARIVSVGTLQVAEAQKTVFFREIFGDAPGNGRRHVGLQHQGAVVTVKEFKHLPGAYASPIPAENIKIFKGRRFDMLISVLIQRF